MRFNPSLYINWEKFNRWLIVYIGVFFIIGVLQSMWKGYGNKFFEVYRKFNFSDEEKEKKRKQKAVYSERSHDPTPRERLQEMIYRTPPDSVSSEWYDDRPPPGRPPGH